MMKFSLVIISVATVFYLLVGIAQPVIAMTDPYAGCPAGRLNTALGCIPVKNATNNFDEMAFIGWVVRNMAFVASGVAFLLMVFGGIKILTSAGSSESIKAGSELITAALTGLLFIIFSILILRIIGTDILQIPGF